MMVCVNIILFSFFSAPALLTTCHTDGAVTKWMFRHPGGPGPFLHRPGGDVSADFHGMRGHGQRVITQVLPQFKIGDLIDR